MRIFGDPLRTQRLLKGLAGMKEGEWAVIESGMLTRQIETAQRQVRVSTITDIRKKPAAVRRVSLTSQRISRVPATTQSHGHRGSLRDQPFRG